MNSNEIEMAAQLDKDADHNPLIAACFHDDLPLVRRLVREGVDVNRAVSNAFTPLIMAAPLGRYKIVQFLLKSGADVNQTVVNGNNAVHECVKYDSLKCLKLLVNNGARLDMKYQGMTPLLMASREGRAEIVDYLIRLPSCTRAARIEARELLGAAFVDDMEDLESAHFHWSSSLAARRGARSGDNVQPKRQEPHPAFQVKEFQTEEELTAMQFDELAMQSLLIRERILGPQNSHTVTYIIRRAAADADEGNIGRSNLLMAYVLDIQLKSDGVGDWPLKEFSSLLVMLSKVMHESSPVKYKNVMAVFIKIVDILEHKMKPTLDPKRPWNCTNYNGDLHQVICSVSIMVQLQPTVSSDERLEFRQLARRIVHLNVRDLDGNTPLHVACLYGTPHSPLDVVQLLLDVGADPQAVSLSGDTILHCVAYDEHPTQHEIIKLLLSLGAHYDACNAEGQCFAELLASGNKFMAGNPMDYCSLQCLSAKAVKRSGIPYESIVPTYISEFIKLH